MFSEIKASLRQLDLEDARPRLFGFDIAGNFTGLKHVFDGKP
jgi:hypothetical protein